MPDHYLLRYKGIPPAAGRGAMSNDVSVSPAGGGWPGDALGLKLFNSSSDWLTLVGSDGRITLINDAGRRVLDDSAGSQIGANWLDQWPAGMRPVAERAFEQAKIGLAGRFAAKRVGTNGVSKSWDLSITLLSGEGSSRFFLVSGRDVTLQEQFESRLLSSEQRFRALADHIPQLAWMADREGNFFWYNQRWFDYTGTTYEDVAGWGWQRVHHPDHIERVVARFKHHLVIGQPWEDTFPIRAADGSYRWFLSRAMPIRNDQDDIVLWCGTNTDVTEQRSTSDRLRQKARIIELSHEAILVWELKDGRIVTWNRGCRELYGYAADEALGRSSHQLVRGSNAQAIQLSDFGLKRDGSWSGEQLHRAKDGSEVWVDSRQEVIDIAGRQVVLETNRDITARREFDQMTQLLMAELDHRVKNTLAIVQSIASQTALRSATFAAFNRSFSARLQALASAHSLLTASHWAGADLFDLLQSQLVETIGDERTVVAAGPRIFLPPQSTLQLGLILFELASNARKHGALSRPGGKIHVTWSNASTSDPGIFELVWQERGGPPVEPPTSRGFGTTLIERAGSQPHLRAILDFRPDGLECRITAQVAQTSTFAAFFNPQLRDAPIPAAAKQATAATVLIIEDEPLIAAETETILTKAGYRTAGPCSTVQQALDMIETAKPDLAVVDGSLRGEPVDIVVDRLRAGQIPFVVVTSLTHERLPAAVDPLSVLRKPVAAAQLLNAVALLAAMGGSQPGSRISGH